MNFLFLMNPLESVQRLKDTTYAFMIGAVRRGHRVYYVPLDGVSLLDGGLQFDVEEVAPTPEAVAPFERRGVRRMAAGEADALFIRTDPPFDAKYLIHTWLLDHAPPGLYVMNDPAGVRAVNEKVWALQFTDLVPPSLVTQSAELARVFLAEHEVVVAKPTDGFGGQGVFVVRDGEPNTNVILETLTDKGQDAIIVQRFIPEAEAGDKRILLLAGEPLGAVLRLHGKEDHRNNFFAGGQPHPAELTDLDREIIDELAPHLRALGLAFVGIDVIGDYLIEVNVTSPTCLQEMNRLYSVRLEDRVVEYVEQQVQSRRGPSSQTHVK